MVPTSLTGMVLGMFGSRYKLSSSSFLLFMRLTWLVFVLLKIYQISAVTDGGSTITFPSQSEYDFVSIAD